MKDTRTQILELLRREGECSVQALAEEVGIAVSAMRRHLDILEGEGQVEYRQVRKAAGRPYFAYRLTEQAKESPAAGYARLLERLLSSAATLPAEDGSHALLATLLDSLSAHLAEEYRAKIHGSTLEERARSLTEALRSEGLVDQVERRADGIHLITSTCPHRRAAIATAELCDAELRTIATLLGEDVQQVARLVDGANCCEYVVKPKEHGQLISLGA